MNIIASINGREAVPLRAVPFMDGWNALYPERIVEWLESQPDTPRAFRVDNSGTVTSIEHRFWYSTLKRLEGLVPDDAPRIEWERESVKLIPAEAFMWLDDVLALFRDVGAARVLEHHPVFVLGDEPTFGAVHIGTDGLWSYFPVEGHVGHDKFTIEFDRANGQKEVVQVTVNVVAGQKHIDGLVPWATETTSIPLWSDGSAEPLVLSRSPLIPSQLEPLIEEALQWLPQAFSQDVEVTTSGSKRSRNEVHLDEGGSKEDEDSVRRLKLLRSLGGRVKGNKGAWKFTGMTALVKAEAGKPRSSEKTIRQDLREAADKEADAKRCGVLLGQLPTTNSR